MIILVVMSLLIIIFVSSTVSVQAGTEKFRDFLGCWRHERASCVTGRNIGTTQSIIREVSIKECQRLCTKTSGCASFEYGVNHGGKGKAYKPMDCQLNTGIDTSGCNGTYKNLDLFVRVDCPAEVFQTLRLECTVRRDISEHCHLSDEGIWQYSTCQYNTQTQWLTRVTMIKCNEPEIKCIQKKEDGKKLKAKCVNPTIRPDFPSKGIIFWEGSEEYDPSLHHRGKWAKKVNNMRGYIRKDMKGNLIRTERKVHRWPNTKFSAFETTVKPAVYKTLFEVIKPITGEQGKFNRIHGTKLNAQSWDNAQQCQQNVLTLTKNLSSIWKAKWTKYYLKHTKKLNAITERQTWVEEEMRGEWSYKGTWVVDYNKEKGFAIPFSSTIFSIDEWWGITITKRNYTYCTINCK